MPFLFPQFEPPTEALTACIEIPLGEHERVADVFPDERMVSVIRFEQDGRKRVIRIIREKFDAGTGHFHVDFVTPTVFPTLPQDNCDRGLFDYWVDRLLNLTVPIRFESRFLMPTEEVGNNSLLSAWGGVSINFDGMQTKLMGGLVRLNDTVYREVRWRSAARRDGQAMTTIDILGQLGPHTISQDLFTIIGVRAEEGRKRFARQRRREHDEAMT